MENEQLTTPVPLQYSSAKRDGFSIVLSLVSLLGTVALLISAEAIPFGFSSVSISSFQSEANGSFYLSLILPVLLILLFASSSLGILIIPLFFFLRGFHLSLFAYSAMKEFSGAFLSVFFHVIPLLFSWMALFLIGEISWRSSRYHFSLSLGRSPVRSTSSFLKRFLLSALLLTAAALWQQIFIPLVLPHL